MEARFVGSIAEFGEQGWDRLAGEGYPFTRYAFLEALESSGAVGGRSGWHVHHLGLYEGGELVAALPCYQKQHSYGEYVFDWSWADAYQRSGLDYYPKLLCAIPFTPATGPRLLCSPERLGLIWPQVLEALEKEVAALKASSAHLLMLESEQMARLVDLGFPGRTGVQYHWQNEGYEDFEQFLDTFNSRKRKSLRKERRRVAEQGVVLHKLSGTGISEADMRRFYRFYQITYARRSGHGGYLGLEFFLKIREKMADSLLLVLAERDGEIIAGALNFIGADALYGRYWGAVEEVDGLHFEACYYQGIEFCIERGLLRFDPGAQGEHKIQRGFRPVPVYSNHYIAHPGFREAIERFLVDEELHIEDYMQRAAELLPFKK